MSEWRTDYPSWDASGKLVEWKRPDGTVDRGRLVASDTFYDGDYEWPVFEIEDGAGNVFSIDPSEPWRYVAQTEESTEDSPDYPNVSKNPPSHDVVNSACA